MVIWAMREIVNIANMSIRESGFKGNRYLDFYVEYPDEEYSIWCLTEDEVRRLTYALNLWMEPATLREGPIKAEISRSGLLKRLY